MDELGILDLMLPAFAECLVLVGIHSYLGLHVIRRKVIFVDLALAQVAALGTTVGFLFGMAPDSLAALFFAMLFTFVGAAVFSITRLRGDKIPQEAVIGLVYALAAAVVILVVDRAPHGAEHIKELMTGAILWVRWETIAFSAAVYAGVGVFHFLFRHKFLLISDNPEAAYTQGLWVRWWDFLFYLSFGVVISISVQTAGVLLVFVFLVVPAIVATLITTRLRVQLFIGWAVGTAVSLIGLAISYYADSPSGPTVVSFYGAMLILLALILFVVKATDIVRALIKLAVGFGVAAVVAGLFFVIGNALGGSHLATGRAEKERQVTHVAPIPSSDGGDSALLTPHNATDLLSRLAGKGEQEQEAVLSSVDNAHQDILTKAFRISDDAFSCLAIARHVITHDRSKGACLCYELLLKTQNPFVRHEALGELKRVSGLNIPLDPDQPISAQDTNIPALTDWLRKIDCSP